MDKHQQVVRLFLERYDARPGSGDPIEDIATQVGKSRTFVEDVLREYGVQGTGRHQRGALTVTPEVIERLRDAMGDDDD